MAKDSSLTVPKSPSQGGQGTQGANVPEFDLSQLQGEQSLLSANMGTNVSADTVQNASQNQTTDADIRNRILQQQQAAQQQLQGAMEPTQEEEQLRQQATQLAQQKRNVGIQAQQAQSQLEGQGRGIELSEIQGQQGLIGERAQLQKQTLASQQQAVQSQLENELKARQQEIDQANALLTANQQNLQTLQSLQEMTQPEVLSTQTDEQGNVYTIQRDPQTGEVSQKQVGTVETGGQGFTRTGTFTNQEGQQMFFGVKPDGTIQKSELGKAPTEQADTQVVEAGGQKKLINTQTGETVSVLGAADGGAGGGIDTEEFENDIQNVRQELEFGVEGTRYQGRGDDGYIDPNLYARRYNDILNAYGREGALEFLNEVPPEENINPKALETTDLPRTIRNRVKAGKQEPDDNPWENNK